MAAKKKRSKKSRISLSKLRAIWNSLSVDTWLEILDKQGHAHGWYEKSKGDIWGQCVNHDEDTASFHIVPERGFAHCFGCSYHCTDPIQLIAKVMRQTYSEAFAFIISQYGPIQGFTTKSIEDAKSYAELQDTKRLVIQLLNAELVDAATSFLSDQPDPKYKYAENCLRYLKGRGVPLDLLHTLPLLLVCPPGNLYDRLKSYERETGFNVSTRIQTYLEEVIPKGSGSSRSAFEGWLIFANHLSPNTIGTFRLREPKQDGAKNILSLTDDSSSEDPVGFFGLGTSIFSPLLGKETPQAKTIIVVEGEFDALAGLVPQVMSGDVTSVIVSSGGNANVSLDSLVASGFETISYVSDWDGGGDLVLQSKLRATQDLRFKIFNPPDTFKQAGKDVHDAFQQYGPDVVLKELTNTDNYSFPHQWAIQRTVEEAANLPDGDVRAKTRLAHTYIKLLNDQAERDSFVKNISKALGIEEDSLRRFATPDTDEGFIELACNYLDSVYEFIYQESTPVGKRVVAWNKSSHTQVGFDIGRTNSLLAILRVDLGSIVDWMEHKVGVPPECQPMIDEDGNKVEKPRDRKHKYYTGCLENDIFPRLLQRKTLRMKSDMTSLGQGIHVPRHDLIYVVNGNLVFKGVINEDETIDWQLLSIPQDEEYLFETDFKKRWSTALTTVESICSTPTLPMDELIKRAHNVFDTGFRFIHHELECQYLAAFLLTAPLIDLFDAVPWVFINGPTSSGKSSLNQVLASQDASKRLVNLFEHALAMDNATPAGVKQTMRGSTLALMLDEFEVGPETSYEAKHIRCREILELVRGGMGRGSRIAMGSASGNPVFWTLRFPFVASGIYTFHKQEDTNRFNTIEMAIKDPAIGRIKASSPKYLILDKMSRDVLTQIREDITLSSLRNLPTIRRVYEELKVEYASGQHTSPNTHARFREQLLPVIAVMKAAGLDYRAFSLHYTKSKSQRSAEVTYQNRYEEIWQVLLHTSVLTVPGEETTRQTFTLAQILNDQHRRGMINMMNAGVYYLQEENMLAVVWTTVLGGPLLRHSKYSNYGGPEKIRNIMSQDPHVVDDRKRQNYRGLLPKLAACVGRVQWKDVTFIPASEFILNRYESRENSDNILLLPTGLHDRKSTSVDTQPLVGEDNI